MNHLECELHGFQLSPVASALFSIAYSRKPTIRNTPLALCCFCIPYRKELHSSFRVYHGKGNTWYQEQVELNVHIPKCNGTSHIYTAYVICCSPGIFSHFLFHFLFLCSNCRKKWLDWKNQPLLVQLLLNLNSHHTSEEERRHHGSLCKPAFSLHYLVIVGMNVYSL